jgi:predicted DNA-binding protein
MTATVNLVVRLSEPLRRQAQIVAKLRGETVSDVVRAALREYVRESIEDARDLREAIELNARIDGGQEPLLDHDDVWREIEQLEAAGVLPA